MEQKIQLTKNIFDEIYKNSLWGSKNGISTSGRGSHAPEFVTPYCEQMSDFLKKFINPKILDLGCGDFNIGQKLIKENHNWIAYDISDVIITRNKKYFDKSNLTFASLDFCEHELPNADIAFVRQVFQHLENEKILSFVKKLNAKKNIEYLIVTEHIPFGEFTPNIDKPTDHNVRLQFNSGVVLDAAPFNLEFTLKEDVLKIKTGNSIVQSTIYKIK